MERRFVLKVSAVFTAGFIKRSKISIIYGNTDKTIVLQTFSDLLEAKAMQHKLEEPMVFHHPLTDETMCLGWILLVVLQLKIFDKDKEAALKLIASITLHVSSASYRSHTTTAFTQFFLCRRQAFKTKHIHGFGGGGG
jgi:hypothetical protein